MGFQLSETVDRNKVFLVKRSEIEGRLDPLIALYRRKVRRFRYQTHQLAKLLKIPPRYGANEAGKTRANNEEPRYIRITDIDAHGLLKNEIGVTAEIIEPKYILKNNDILFARSGATVGKAYIHKIKNVEYPCFYAGYMIRFVFNDDMVNPDYVFSFTQLNIYKEWVQAIQRAAGQPNINAEEYKSLMVPLPPVKVQNEIASKMNAAYSAKKEKEAEAQRLLDSIDDYLLKELGIEVPEEEENTIQKRMFIRRFSEVSGGRFDAPVHHKQYSLYTKAYPMKRLKDYILINPISSFYKYDPDKHATFIPMECVSDNYGEADISQTRIVSESGGYTKFFENDLLWAKITPCMQNGKSAVVEHLENGIGFGSTEFHVFRPFEDMDIRYVHALLRLKSLRNYAMLYFSGSAGHQRVSDNFFKRLVIPKPPIDKQTQIAAHINSIRSKAKQLHEHATAELEQAKKEVEKMILGDTD